MCVPMYIQWKSSGKNVELPMGNSIVLMSHFDSSGSADLNEQCDRFWSQRFETKAKHSYTAMVHLMQYCGLEGPRVKWGPEQCVVQAPQGFETIFANLPISIEAITFSVKGERCKMKQVIFRSLGSKWKHSQRIILDYPTNSPGSDAGHQ